VTPRFRREWQDHRLAAPDALNLLLEDAQLRRLIMIRNTLIAATSPWRSCSVQSPPFQPDHRGSLP